MPSKKNDKSTKNNKYKTNSSTTDASSTTDNTSDDSSSDKTNKHHKSHSTNTKNNKNHSSRRSSNNKVQNKYEDINSDLSSSSSNIKKTNKKNNHISSTNTTSDDSSDYGKNNNKTNQNNKSKNTSKDNTYNTKTQNKQFELTDSEEDKIKKEYNTIDYRVNIIQQILKYKKVKPLTIVEKKDDTGNKKNYVVHTEHDDEITDCNDIRCILDKDIQNFHTFLHKFGDSLKYIKSGSTGHTFKLKGKNEKGESYALAVKIVAFPKDNKYGDIYDIRRPENAELLMIHILSRFVTNKKTGHIVLPLGTFYSDIKTFVTLTQDEYKEKKNYNKFLKKYQKGEFHNQISILISEWANGGDLLDFLRSKAEDLSTIQWKVIFFQILSVISVIQLRFPDFRHNDLKANNILIQNIPLKEKNNWIQYLINNQYYIVSNVGIYIKLWDFDFACIPNLVINTKVDANWANKRLNVKSKKNCYYDIHFFFNTLRKYIPCLKSPSKYVSKEVTSFIERVVPSKYRNKDILSESGRLLINDEYTTSLKLIENDDFFEEFRHTEKEVLKLSKKK